MGAIPLDPVVMIGGTQTVTGPKTFTTPVAVPPPLADSDAVNKGYLTNALAPLHSVFALTRAQMRSLPSNYLACYLLEAGRQGWFQWTSGNLAARVTADPQQGVYVPPTGQTGSNGAWVRVYNGPMMARWFGAKPDGATDSTTALLGMLSLLKAFGGAARFDGDGGVDVYLTKRLLISGPLPYPIALECDPNVWLTKADATTHFNILDIYDCENVTLGNLNFNLRQSENPALFVSDNPDGTRNWTTDNLGYGLTIRNCSYVSHSGKIRVHDYHEGLLVYTTVTTDPPVYHDVSLDYVELHAYVETDEDGHVLDGGWAVAGVIIVNMMHSGVRFIDVVGVLQDQPGFAIEFKLDCRDCWFNGFIAKQSHVAISALGTGTGTAMDAINCWFGPGLIDHCKVAIAISHGERVTFAHVRARHHPDLWPDHPLGTPPWFIQISGNSTDVTVMCEIIDYDGGVNDEPPIYVGGDRNTVIVPMINNAVPKYATIAAGSQHCSVAIWQDVSLSSGVDVANKFIDLSGDDTNIYYVSGGGGFDWRAGASGGVKLDSNELSVRQDADGDANLSGQNYLALSAQHLTTRGIQRVVPINGFSLSIGTHTAQLLLEPAGALASGTINLPAGGRGKLITIVSTANVSAVALNPASANSVVGWPGGLTANVPVTLRFLDETAKWYRA